jgi:hypothetical protein
MKLRHQSLSERAADRISRFAGSMSFVYPHLVLLASGSPSTSCRWTGTERSDVVNTSGLIPFSICFHATGAAIGNPARGRGEQLPTAVVPRPLRK